MTLVAVQVVEPVVATTTFPSEVVLIGVRSWIMQQCRMDRRSLLKLVAASPLFLLSTAEATEQAECSMTALPAQTFAESAVGERLALDTSVVAQDIALIVAGGEVQVPVGQQFFDATLNAFITWNGSVWTKDGQPV